MKTVVTVTVLHDDGWEPDLVAAQIEADLYPRSGDIPEGFNYVVVKREEPAARRKPACRREVGKKWNRF